jgi:ribosomal protein S6--L-glutamate ligase
VNSSPGLEGIERATGVGVADAIIELVENEVAFKEIDIRQRLTLKSGYGMMDIPVSDRSELAGRTLRDARLRERDIVVLNITRGDITLPNPRSTTEILSGDILLCFGDATALKALAPPLRKKKKKKRSVTPGGTPVVTETSGETPEPPDVEVAPPAASDAPEVITSGDGSEPF